eukprot:3680245-Amphidinium_carterae.1
MDGDPVADSQDCNGSSSFVAQNAGTLPVIHFGPEQVHGVHWQHNAKASHGYMLNVERWLLVMIVY